MKLLTYDPLSLESLLHFEFEDIGEPSSLGNTRFSPFACPALVFSTGFLALSVKRCGDHYVAKLMALRVNDHRPTREFVGPTPFHAVANCLLAMEDDPFCYEHDRDPLLLAAIVGYLHFHQR